MLSFVNYVISRFVVFINFLNSLVITRFNDHDITLLGFIGALLVCTIAIRLMLPKTK
jgi:hypothetical protein